MTDDLPTYAVARAMLDRLWSPLRASILALGGAPQTIQGYAEGLNCDGVPQVRERLRAVGVVDVSDVSSARNLARAMGWPTVEARGYAWVPAWLLAVPWDLVVAWSRPPTEPPPAMYGMVCDWSRVVRHIAPLAPQIAAVHALGGNTAADEYFAALRRAR